MNYIRSVNWIITNQCNSRCSHCDIWRSDKIITPDLDEIIKIIKDPFIKKCYRHYGQDFDVSLCGGEPFLVPHLQGIVDNIQKYLPESFKSITTNGLLTNTILEFVKNNMSTRYKINVSIDGIGKVHDRIRGGNDFFKRTTGTVFKIKKLYPTQKVELKFTLLPQNYDQILKVYELSKIMGCDFTFKPAENIKSYTNQRKNISLKFNKNQLCSIRNQAFNISDSYYEKGDYKKAQFFKDIAFYLYAKEKKEKCSVLSSDISILPSGHIYTCLLMRPIGNTHSNSIGKIWKKHPISLQACPSCMLMCGAYKNYSNARKKHCVANIETTIRCNLKCDMCTQSELRAKKTKDMDLPTFKKIIIKNSDITHASFVGGEPFLNKNLFGMLRFLDSKHITSEITTNGTIIKPKDVRYLKDIVGLKLINFSLDGDREKNDKIRGLGVFNKCLSALSLTRKFFNISVSTVIRKDNLNEIKKLCKLLKRMGIKRHKFILGMNINKDLRNMSKKIINSLNIQGPRFEYQITNQKKIILFFLQQRKRFEDSNYKIVIEPEYLDTTACTPSRPSTKNDLLTCKQFKQYRFTTTGRRIICEFIRNGYNSKIIDLISKNGLLPICNDCCKLRPKGRFLLPIHRQFNHVNNTHAD